MTDLIWLNGSILPFAEARLGVEDRGFQFADGVYEVIRLYSGRPFTLNEHLDRLERSAAGIRLTVPLQRERLSREIHKLIQATGVGEGMIYLQLTRGVAPRNHVFPEKARPTLLFYARPLPPVPQPGAGAGAKLMSVPDERWKRCWIKSIALLPNVLAKDEAVAAGADEAVFVNDGVVTECSASNLLIVKDGIVRTHPVGEKVLPGITRAALCNMARGLGIEIREEAISLETAQRADEVFITSTTREISWVSEWDGKVIGTKCGEFTRRLHEALRKQIEMEVSRAA